MQFAERLKSLRRARKISQAALSVALTQAGCPISKSSINMYERGEREPSFETLECIADFFNVDMNYLLGKSDVINENESLIQISDVYLSLARTAQEERINPRDIQLALDYIKKLRSGG